jgi:uncharacterized protein YjbI with pentapeptide repeats
LFYDFFVKNTHSLRSERTRQPCEVVFTAAEKRQLGGEVFRGSKLDYVDFSRADLREARFEGASLCGCDFSGTDLRGAVFEDCDLRWSRFDRAIFGNNSFRRSWLTGSEGITRSVFEYVRTRGGHFLYC